MSRASWVYGRRSNKSGGLGGTTEKRGRSGGANASAPRRSAIAQTEASTAPSGKSAYLSTSSAILGRGAFPDDGQYRSHLRLWQPVDELVQLFPQGAHRFQDTDRDWIVCRTEWKCSHAPGGS